MSRTSPLSRTTAALFLAAITVVACQKTERSYNGESPEAERAGATSETGPNMSDTAGAKWLDAQLKSWNSAGVAVPRAPKAGEAKVYAARGRCAAGLPKLQSHADSAVALKGWTPVGTAQKFGNMRVVTGAVDADGMCRPFKYQTFVFVNNQYAGTLSPVAMNSRTDGALALVKPEGAIGLSVSFSRYASSDALCCPSRTTVVHYRIAREGGQPVVVPAEAQTHANEVPHADARTNADAGAHPNAHANAGTDVNTNAHQ